MLSRFNSIRDAFFPVFKHFASGVITTMHLPILPFTRFNFLSWLRYILSSAPLKLFYDFSDANIFKKLEALHLKGSTEFSCFEEMINALKFTVMLDAVIKTMM